jgi:hypothetical protein
VRLRLALAAVVLVTGVACTGDDEPQPSPTTRDSGSTTVVDRSGIALAGVPGQTTSTIVERGTANLTGSVQGPSGLVVGATVRIERLVAGREIRTDVLTGPDGRFALPGVPGGRYRVRAFLAPALAQVVPEVRFLEDGADHDFPLVVEQQGGLLVRADVAPEPPILDRAVNLVAVVSTRSVDADGVVRSQPVVGVTVELSGLGRWTLRDDAVSTTSTTDTPFEPTFTIEPSQTPSARTDAGGMVRYELRCDRPGNPNLALRVPVRSAPPVTTDPTATTFEPAVTVQTFSLDLPACVDPATTTTASTAPLSTTTTRG